MYDLVVYQAGAVEAFARAAGVRLHHVKCHGALYNMAANDEALSDAMARAVKDLGAGVLLYALSNSGMMRTAQQQGVRVAGEVFADRGYADDGTLAPRGRPGAMIEDANLAAARALEMVEKRYVTSLSGKADPGVARHLVRAWRPARCGELRQGDPQAFLGARRRGRRALKLQATSSSSSSSLPSRAA